MRSETREKLAPAIAEMPVFNHHEHAWPSFSRSEAPLLDLPSLIGAGYLTGDLLAVGYVPAPDVNAYLEEQGDAYSQGVERAWSALLPYLEKVRNTSYFRSVARTLEDVFGISQDDIFSERWRQASDRMLAYSREHRGRAAALSACIGIRATVVDVMRGSGVIPEGETDGDCYLFVERLDSFIHEELGLPQLLEKHNAKHFDEWLTHFDEAFQRALTAGVAGFKSTLAYCRRIEYADPSEQEAARVFERGVLAAAPAEQVIYQDFLVNRLCRLCVAADVPLQIHSGIQAGIGNTLENARPTCLTSMFQRHPDLRVDLFHGGYPWFRQAGLMAKYFPNVYIDGCWLSHISPEAYRLALRSWLDTVPYTKIFAFGGDHHVFECTCGALALARELIADVLAEMVDEGHFSMEFALEIARAILYENGARFWRLEQKGV